MLIVGEENIKAMQRAADAADEGRIRCKKCGNKLISVFQICECGGHSCEAPKGVVLIDNEEEA